MRTLFCHTALNTSQLFTYTLTLLLVWIHTGTFGCSICFSICRAEIEAPLTLPLSVDIAEDDLWRMEDVGLFLQYIAEQHAEESESLSRQCYR